MRSISCLTQISFPVFQHFPSPFHLSTSAHPISLPFRLLTSTRPVSPPTPAKNDQSRGRQAGCQRGPRPARPSPDSLLPISEELLGGAGGRNEGPASYRGLGLRHAVAGLPSVLWPPPAAAGTGLASGPLVPALSGSSIYTLVARTRRARPHRRSPSCLMQLLTFI